MGKSRVESVADCVREVVAWLGEKYPAAGLEMGPALDSFSGPTLTLCDVWETFGVHPNRMQPGSSIIECVHLGVLCDNPKTVIFHFEKAIAERRKVCAAAKRAKGVKRGR